MTFDRDKYLNDLKKEVGLSEIPYENLYRFKVCLAPTGYNVKEEDYISAKDYVDRELEKLEKSFYENLNQDLIVSDCNVENLELTNKDLKLLKDVEQKDHERDKYYYFDVFDGNRQFLVGIFKIDDAFAIENKLPTFTDQVNFVKNHWAYRGTRSRKDINNLDIIISFYQFVNHIDNIKNPADLSAWDNKDLWNNITTRMEKTFDGIKIQGF